ncbi:putative serine/threonine-protein kinase UCNL AGC-RSK-2 family [Arabidopsis thaliana]|jgi:serine/threonine protein kinase|uniref:Serine/threonine-protein kinase UCNL n=3 Tax=Arabidopsis TaxID=3701 RepID=UNCL_ARATH|nr:AGC (cAMP-dependent, cGMP-dependent and protein kinase C) kinase family protein [Arabidopsis thaliana]Q9LT38.1 RecName: Full=Serine/threonine-protein kinase UCNL; AltName: Full=AGC serine/threonine-protein kinase subfamily 2 member 4; AltName: Full=Protein UNICORN-LIKE [Arabidopsis thaliana]KAG7626009.1 Protein kinase domain [Arabidopsis thaliana x Arabidopsis arenosa]ABH04560.1 At3g20830 [Arabidopsis thaliana]AEE76429.1 AGC (cAMP-dependent, cGMP-dependent and protein kinase C) kinase family|eukprot:NP_188719.1 AGC (cAMP-dependent, cGMP-dependent and protein kinase C) kinase family protein [Arabidopsis thaliana]
MEPSPSSPPSSPPEILDLDSIKALKILGKGATGTVFLAHDVVSTSSSSSPFAVKLVPKSSASSLRRARWEIEVLRRLSVDSNQNPFLPRLLASFESPEYFAWAVPYCSGGDLNVLLHRQNDGVFSSSVIRFYVAEIVCALEHLHTMGIAYRDLKPENILIQQSGHVTLTDFDLSRSLKKPLRPHFYQPDPELIIDRKKSRSFSRLISPTAEKNKTGLKKTRSARVNPINRRKTSFSSGERSNSFVGTDEYVSPEVIRGDGHDFAVDWWALGVLTYEMMYGETPFKGKSKKETFRNVLMKEPEFAGKPNDLTDLIRRLLVKDPNRRLGCHRGAAEIKELAFFAGVRWDLLTEVLRPPFIPLRDDGELTVGGFDIREHFEKLRTTPSSAPPSPLRSPPHVCRKNDPFIEF